MSVNSTVASTRSGSGACASAGEELLDLAERPVDVLVPQDVVVAGQLDEPRVRQVLGEPAPVADVDEAVAAAMEDERRDVDARHHVAHVDVEEHLDQRRKHPGARAGALHAGPERPALGVVGLAGRADLDHRALAPVRPDQLGARLEQRLAPASPTGSRRPRWSAPSRRCTPAPGRGAGRWPRTAGSSTRPPRSRAAPRARSPRRPSRRARRPCAARAWAPRRPGPRAPSRGGRT